MNVTGRKKKVVVEGSVDLPDSMPGLEYLDLTSAVDVDLPSEMPDLRFLFLPPRTYSRLPRELNNLEYLKMSETVRIEKVPYSHFLRELWARESMLEDLPQYMSSMEILDLSGTRVESIPRGMIHLKLLSVNSGVKVPEMYGHTKPIPPRSDARGSDLVREYESKSRW